MSGYGKIKDCMLNTDSQVKPGPPRLIPSLVEGFNAVAGRIHLIFFPIAIDLFLWFGPLVRVKDLLMPVMARAAELSGEAYGEQGAEIIRSSNELWAALLEGFNLLFGLRSYPIGVPSLMVSQGAQQNPLGALRIIEVTSFNNALYIGFGAFRLWALFLAVFTFFWWRGLRIRCQTHSVFPAFSGPPDRACCFH